MDNWEGIVITSISGWNYDLSTEDYWFVCSISGIAYKDWI